MSKEVLTHSESYVKKTNRIILVVGLTSFVIFVIGVMLLMQSGPGSGGLYRAGVYGQR